MSKNQLETDWSFPSVRSYNITVPGRKGTFLTLSASKELIDSYLERFGCVPVFDGNPHRRKLARPNKDSGWEVSDPDGSTELETPPELIDGVSNQLRLLTTHAWNHIGYNFLRELTEFDFGKDGEGYSRHASWGYDTTVPKVQDYYWRFSIKENVMNIEWEGERNTQIAFVLKKELRAASSAAAGDLKFYDMTLKVDAPLFPPSADFAQYLLKEYWGQLKRIEEGE